MFFSRKFCNNSVFCNRYASLTNRLTLLRSTAFLKFFVLTPAPNFISLRGALTVRIYTRKGLIAKLFPSLNNCSISFRLFSRSFFPNVNDFANGIIPD